MAIDAPPQYAPPGHFYSPVPSNTDIERAVSADASSEEITGINFRELQQLRLLDRLAKYYGEIPFPADKVPRFRFAFNNPSYSWSDAIILFCMIREIKPRRIVEIGSGYTSALMLDTNELFFNNAINCTLIEPYADLLHSLLRPADLNNIQLISRPLQEVEHSFFDDLRANDILFIDSSHVVKAGSDCQMIFSSILPALAQGTLVHFHDVFANFEYPADWLREGRGWNEQYILRAFLQFNSEFRVKLFTPLLISKYPHWFHEHMPNCFLNTGGHIWIERMESTFQADTPNSPRA